MVSIFETDTIGWVAEISEFDSGRRCRWSLQQWRVFAYAATIPHARHFYQFIVNTPGQRGADRRVGRSGTEEEGRSARPDI